ncbi:MAG TPA: HU family DNA-binding protein [Pirellulales bacterium]|nr:HU family DNA-binding protein [Pirellulales bacterium]
MLCTTRRSLPRDEYRSARRACARGARSATHFLGEFCRFVIENGVFLGFFALQFRRSRHLIIASTTDGLVFPNLLSRREEIQIMAKAANGSSAPAKKAPTKSEVMNSIAETTGLSKKDVANVFEALGNEIKKSMSSKGAGIFTIPGVVKITKKKKPATPARKNVPNPFKPGEFRDIPAKPASMQVKVRALKQLKAMV